MAQTQQAAGQMAMRLKTFDEMDDAQKIAYLHSELKGLIQANRFLQQRVAALESHRHGPEGSLLVPINHANQVGGMLGGYGY
jgi:hypothetical protein